MPERPVASCPPPAWTPLHPCGGSAPGDSHQGKGHTGHGGKAETYLGGLREALGPIHIQAENQSPQDPKHDEEGPAEAREPLEGGRVQAPSWGREPPELLGTDPVTRAVSKAQAGQHCRLPARVESTTVHPAKERASHQRHPQALSALHLGQKWKLAPGPYPALSQRAQDKGQRAMCMRSAQDA